MRIAIAGGSGTVGRHVVEVVRAHGHESLVLARAEGVDLVTGRGLDLTGVDAVIDVSGTSTQSAKRSRGFFSAATGNLLAAGALAAVRHHVALSIVGVDRAPHGYYAGKAAQEQLIAAGRMPWTVLRATQFHEFAEQMVSNMRFARSVGVPSMRTRPVAARTVAERLVEVAEGEPEGFALEIAGPREERMAQMVRDLIAARGDGLRVLEVPLPGRFGRALRDGSILPSGSGAAYCAGPSFAEWLARS
ncbi:SDR family oxidoreductase [Leucobacter sp. NPDC058333]|uniref:SDR family oxidoreductase n=1 Tax=Leucobacter sp. NPDC058333 TaxID=3346450 RepID=UPI0036666C55